MIFKPIVAFPLLMWRLKGLISKTVFARGVERHGLYFLEGSNGVREFDKIQSSPLVSHFRNLLSLRPILISPFKSRSLQDLWHCRL